MKAILGIGNPGKEYDGTRHNCGFDVIDALVVRFGLQLEKQKKWKTRVARFDYAGEKVLLLRPETFVNLSGQTAQAACTFHKIAAADLLVVVDDIHLDLGSLRLRAKGSAGGHNGLKDIESRLGRAYPRLRLGIGKPKGDQIGHVLGRWAPDERDDARDMFAKACECALTWISKGTDAAMAFNGPLRPPPPKPKPAPKPKPDSEKTPASTASDCDDTDSPA